MTTAPSGSRCTRLAWIGLAACAGLGSAGCGPVVATPVPEPPTLQLDHVGPSAKGVQPATNGTHLYGSPGAAPVGAIVRVTNLDGKDLPSVANVASDGSFDVVLDVASGQELRFDWARGTEHGEPQDARFLVQAATFHLEPSERFACLRLTPGFAVDFGAASSQALLIDNECPAAVSLSAARTRLGLPDFSLTTALPLELAPGARSPLALAFTRSQPNAREDTLFFDVTNQGTTIRYPITLLAPASP